MYTTRRDILNGCQSGDASSWQEFFLAYLGRLVTNTAIDIFHARAKRREVNLPEQRAMDCVTSDPGGEERWEREHELCFRRLVPKRHRRAPGMVLPAGLWISP